MKVLALTTWCPYPMINGSAIRQYHMVRALSARHQVDLITFSAPAAPSPDDIAHLSSFCRTVTVIPRTSFTKIPGARAGLLAGTPRSLVETDDPDVRRLLAERFGNVDLAVGLGLSAARYLEGAPVPAVFEEAEPRQILDQIDGAYNWRQRARLRLTWWKQARYLRRLTSAMAVTTVACERERLALAAAGAPLDRVHIVPNGADGADVTRPRTVAEPARLIYPGAITYAPNLEAVVWFLARVMPLIRVVHPNLEFWVTGDTGTLPLDRIPNFQWATFTGRLPDVKDAVSGSTVTVVPLLSGSGTRLKVLESMALGTPVVSTTKGAEGLDLEPGVHLLTADSAADFADRVLDALNDPALAARLSRDGRERVRSSYTWDAIGARFCDIVAAAVAGET
jgi:glycosyltransferase involved in cell wall biosynthesis